MAGLTVPDRVVVVIPTLGRSPHLSECLVALDAAGKEVAVDLQIVLVDQGERPVELLPDAAERVHLRLRLERNEGFAGGTNRGIESALAKGEAEGEVPPGWIAAVNDDAVVESQWLAHLLEALRAHPLAAAAQGLNHSLDGTLVDGAGIEWNPWHQAIQRGHGEATALWEAAGESAAIFGVSATAALYRWQALDRVRLANGDILDSTLESYYEDVELAGRLQDAGFTALYVPQARAGHGASVTGRTLGPGGVGRLRRLRGNRYRVLARRPGFWGKLPKAFLRDALDLAKALVTLRWVEAAGVVLGWGWALVPRHGTPRGLESSRGRPETDGTAAQESGVASMETSASAQQLDHASTPKGPELEDRHGEDSGPPPSSPLQLSAVVIHWRNEDLLERLLESWPSSQEALQVDAQGSGPRWELLVVDNSDSTADLEERYGGEGVRWVHRGENLGFAGGVNRGLATARGEAVLILNPDVHPEPGAVEALLEGLKAHPEAAGLAPRLVGEDGAPQAAWQLRRLPGPVELLLQTLLVPTGGGPAVEPLEGTPVEQPAAAALLIRRRTLETLGGMDESFQPAWFEDVDLAKRLQDRGEPLLYWPRASFRHRLGATVPRLGYGRFLRIYYRNLERYLRKHHGPLWALLSRLSLSVGMILRLALLPLRKPQRAASRGEAARGLLGVLAGALSGWRWPSQA